MSETLNREHIHLLHGESRTTRGNRVVFFYANATAIFARLSVVYQVLARLSRANPPDFQEIFFIIFL